MELLTIGEFARLAGLSISAVRFYSDRGVLAPADVDPSSGYRYYSPSQVEAASLVRDLRLMQMPLATITDVLDATADVRRELIDTHVRGLEGQLHKAQSIADRLGVAAQENTMTTTTMQASDFAHALDQILPAAGTNPERPSLMSVLVEHREGSLRLVATDSFRLAIRDMVPNSSDGDVSAVVAAATLHRWQAELRTDTAISIEVIDRSLRLRGTGIELECLSETISFPDYEQILSGARAVATTVVADRESLLEVLDRFDEDVVRLRISQGQIGFASDTTSGSIPANITGADQELGLNPSFLNDAVRAAVGADVAFEVEQAERPVTLRSADDGTFTTMLMPIRL